MVTVLFARCVGCMAGQEECCSHIASVLFYIEAWNRINEKFICTQPEMKNQDAKRQEIFWMKLWSELDFACTCKRKPLCSEKMLKCHNPFCLSGKFFHLPCLNFKRMPKNANENYGMYGL